MSLPRRLVCLLWILAWSAAAWGAPPATPGVFNVREYGATGDGQALDTAGINRAVETCAAAGGGQVRFAPGTYLSGTVHLKTGVTLLLEAGARLVGSKTLDDYQHYTPPGEGEASGRWHRALVLGQDVENVAIVGEGTIDGNKVFDAEGEEKMRGPHTILLGGCRHVVIRGITIRDSANYAVLLKYSNDIDVSNLTAAGGWDGVHFRNCQDVRITGSRFFTGDDSIAGSDWENVLVSGCVLNSSCNCVRLIGPARHLIIHDCLLYGPGIEPHRSSGRHNTLAGINLQPGAWMETKGSLDDVLLSDLTMRNVSTPFHIVLKPGNQGGRIMIDRVSASGVYLAASSIESWAETLIEEVAFRDVTIEFQGGGKKPAADAAAAIKPPGADARPLPAWGFYARHVGRLRLENVRLDCAEEDLRPVVICDGVERLVLDGFRYPPLPEGVEPIVLKDVGRVATRDGVVKEKP